MFGGFRSDIVKKLYDKIFSLGFMKKLVSIPFFGKILSYEMLSYLFFGVMTTVVNFLSFFVFDKILGSESLFSFTVFSHVFNVTYEDISTVIAWVIAVVFAYVTNKLWVFESKSVKPSVVIRELLSFFAARILSFVLFESLGFMLLRNLINSAGIFKSENAGKWIAKIACSVLVVIFNYIMSKLIVFRKKKEKADAYES